VPALAMTAKVAAKPVARAGHTLLPATILELHDAPCSFALRRA
jgi:hypothetical protein